MDGKTIIIDLDSRIDVASFGSDELIQQDAIIKFSKLLNRSLTDAKAAASPHLRSLPGFNGIRDRQHNAIIFNGGRGSGKTTLLHNVLAAARENRLPDASTSSNRVEVLKVIDPNLIETKENILVIVLSLIKYAVEMRMEHMDKNNPGNEQRRRTASDVRPLQIEWREALRNLADGLTRLDNIGKDKLHDDWDDALYVMETGLQKAYGSITFEESFNDFLAWSLRILEKDLFIVSFDDVDIAFDKGWAVLEVIRKYLTSPYLMVVVSGDISLYSKIIRLKQWKNFGEKLPEEEQKRSHDYENAVNGLEDQYLMKVLKPSNRIDLLRLNTISENTTVCVKTGGKDLQTIADFLNAAIEKHFKVVRGVDLQLYRSLLLRQPVRSVVQFLQAFNVDDANDIVVHNAIAEIAQGSLIRHGVSFGELILADSPDYLSLLREMLNRNKLWDAGYRLRPDFREDDNNLTVIALSAPLTKAINSEPALIFDYLIKVCLPHAVSRYIQSIPGGDMDKYLHFVSRDLREDSLTEARAFVAVEHVRPRRTHFSTSAGVVMVYGARTPDLQKDVKLLIKGADHEKALKGFWSQTGADAGIVPVLGKTHNTWTNLQTCLKVSDKETIMSRVSCLVVCQVSDRSNNSTYCSIFNLLAAIGLLTETNENTTDRGGFADGLKRCSQLRSFPVPNWSPSRGNQQEDTLPNQDDHSTPNTNNSSDPINSNDAIFIRVFEEWSRDLKNQIDNHPVNVHFFSRVWSRFYYTLVSVSSEIPLRDKFLGWMMHRFVITFLNAVMMEEIIDKKTERARQANYLLNNPVINDGNFMSNLGIAMDLENSLDSTGHVSDEEFLHSRHDELRTELPLFAVLFACPLWAPFLSPYVRMQKKYGENRLLDIHISQWRQWAKPEPDSDILSLADCIKILRVPYNTGANGWKDFENLFDPLNSVLVAGRLPTSNRGSSSREDEDL